VNQVINQSEIAAARVKLETQLDELIQLRPLPAIALRIMKSCREEQTNVRDLVKLVECDATISSHILSVVNSSLYGYSRDISSINQAVVVLGFKSLSDLAVSIASEKVFSEGELAIQPRLRLYEHSLACAAIARLLADRPELETDSGAAFLAGMLHDVGKLVLFDVAPDFYSQIQSSCPKTCTIELEQQAFGIDHTSLGAKFAAAWGLPLQINRAIANHHQAVDESSESLLRITALANQLAKIWGIGQTEDPSQCETTAQWLGSTDPETLEELRAAAGQQFLDLKSLLAN
jgi:putative nucleotidyltransferase with HDIG domain